MIQISTPTTALVLKRFWSNQSRDSKLLSIQLFIYLFDNWFILPDFSLSLRVQTGSGAHPASYPAGFGSLFPRG
jgi:hypothetical protein